VVFITPPLFTLHSFGAQVGKQPHVVSWAARWHSKPSNLHGAAAIMLMINLNNFLVI
jgi:hypothetical protein